MVCKIAVLRFVVCMWNFAAVIAQECEEQSLCRHCIALPECTWCSDNTNAGGCFLRNSSLPCTQIEDPHSNTTEIQEGSLSNQVNPSLVRLSLRVGEPENFTVRVTPRAGYPLDLYFLMDLSSSMSDDLNTVKSLSSQLANTIANITGDFQIGFGAFNEKPIEPFVSNHPIPTDYSYRHVISLTNDTRAFTQQISGLAVSANNDNPEALFDGLLQAVVCTEVVGWRENARHLILILTDRGYHIAGDGKLAGIIRPHDGNCYTPRLVGNEPDTRYTMWGVFDYPSVGQINAKLRENDIIPIFAVAQSSTTQRSIDIYQNLLPQIEGGVVEELSSGSQNFLNIIERSYNATAQRVELQPNSIFGVDVAVTPVCSSFSQTVGRACEGVDIGETVAFQVEVTLTTCTEQLRREARQRLDLRVPGFGLVSVEISSICSCGCENEMELNSTECSGTGHLSCGICECLQGWFGQQCQCSGKAAVNLPRVVGLASRQVCSGRGTCECGVCICDHPNSDIVPAGATNPRYYGEACELDNFLCPVNSAGILCSGRGECDRNQNCICMASPSFGDPFRGTACQCPPARESCLNSTTTTNLICNGHGRCNCNSCECEEGFIGRYCETSIVPVVIQCNAFDEDCVRCVKGLTGERCAENCSVVLIDSVGGPNYEINGTTAMECNFIDGDGCLHFYFTTGEGGPIHAENERVCGGLLIPVWAVIVIVLGGILLVGFMLLVIVKIILYAQDQREYKKWEKSQRNPKFGTINSDTTTNPVSVRHVNLVNLPVGVPKTFTVNVTALRNLPLDLYILMDLSNSMSDELNTVKNISGQIADRIDDITNNVRLGFGSFSDKVTRPYTYDTCGSMPREACALYAFRHQIDLTSNITRFNDTIQAVTTTENADSPENGLEALAQVVSCESIIGWRSRAAGGMDRGQTRVVLFLTDDQFHYSGEGRLAGILRPYDGQCYLARNENTSLPINYLRWDEFDYPSVGQVVALLTQFEVVTIFAVDENVLPTYQNLQNLVELRYRASAAVLTTNSQELLDLIEREYRAIVQGISLNVPTMNAADLNIDVRTTCPNGTQPSGMACSNVPLTNSVIFEITVTLNSCEMLRTSDNMTRTVRFSVPTFGDFNLTYSGACNCEGCEQDTVPNSPMCSGNGAFECGVCRCNQGFCGPDCSAQDCSDNCSNRGVCDDCTCMCTTPNRQNEALLNEILNEIPTYVPRVFGDTCECDNFRCGLGPNIRQSCSGRGDCCDRVCQCEVYRGPLPNPTNARYHQEGAPGLQGDCECPPQSVVCCQESPERICNGNGTCRCDICECDTGYTGQCCDILAMCGMNDDVSCVLCGDGGGGDCATCGVVMIPVASFDERQNVIDYVTTNISDMTNYTIQSGENTCDVMNATGCTYSYYILSNGTNVVLGVMDPPVCPETPTATPLAIPIWAIALIILAGLLIIGILILIIIKIIFFILDYLEVKRLEREVKDADISKNQNPLYQSPEVKYENVAYGRE